VRKTDGARRSQAVAAPVNSRIVPRAVAATAVCAASLVASCAPTVQSIAVPTPGRIAPDPDKVTVVVIQPGTRLGPVAIVDGRGQLVGQLDDRTHTVLTLPEGPTVLYAVASNRADTADRLEGTLVAGRLYYATVDPRTGGVALLAFTPRSPDERWRHKDEYLATTTRVQMDPQRIVRAANELPDATAVAKAGDTYLATLPPALLAQHTIQESDGF
jgi:hypothetical protein